VKKRLLFTVLLIATMTISAQARVDIGINVGIPVPLPPTVVIQTAPEFIYSPQLGFYVSAGAPYDIVYIGNDYYLYNNGFYYRSHNFRGPWLGVEARRLPPGLRRHRYEEIRSFRDREYRNYNRDREHYRGRWHRPGEIRRNECRGGEHRGSEGRGGEHRGDEGRGGEHRGGEGRGGEHRGGEGRGGEHRGDEHRGDEGRH
jgi:hypothetical protein